VSKPVAFVFAILAFALAPTFALAYVGPGAGISALGSLFSLLAAVGLAIVGFIWYPIRRLLRRFGSGSKEISSGE
jgi:hypothetical protein